MIQRKPNKNISSKTAIPTSTKYANRESWRPLAKNIN